MTIPLSRYGAVMQPGSTRGPWEEACALQGLSGEMRLVSHGPKPAPGDIAALLGVSEGASAVLRQRHALLEGEVVQAQWAWYARETVRGTPLEGGGKVEGGVWGALSGVGVVPDTADETVWSGLPDPEETETLEIGSGVPVLRVRRVTYCGGCPVEVLRVIAPSDRVELVYDRLPLPPS